MKASKLRQVNQLIVCKIKINKILTKSNVIFKTLINIAMYLDFV